MSKQPSIIALPVFLIVSISFLWMLFPDVKLTVLGNDTYRVVPMNLAEHLDLPDSNELSNGEIRVLNSAYNLYYSIDGGGNFKKLTENKLLLADIENPEIIYRETSIRWRHPQGDFPKMKSLVLKLRDEKKRIESTTETFVFGVNTASKLPVVHLTIPSEDLFGWEKGIMVYGESGVKDEGFQKDWWYRSANFVNRGVNWSKRTSVLFIPTDKKGFNKECEVRISGNATRYFPQKSLKLYPLEDNGRRGKLSYKLLDDEDGNKKMTSFLLRQSGNDNSKTLFADLLMHQLAKGSKVLIQDGYPVSVYINGNYWGIYNLRERYDAYFIGKKENEKAKNVTQLYCEVQGGVVKLKDGKEKYRKEFEEIIENLPQDELNDVSFKELKKKISIKSFTDYIIFETFYGNQDWLHNNTSWYKAGDKKWKWILNDLDYSLSYPGKQNLSANLFDKLLTKNSIMGELFSCLLTNETFKVQFKNRAQEVMESHFNEDRVKTVYTTLKKQYEPEINQHIRRWKFIKNRVQWEADSNENLLFLYDRKAIYLKQIEEL